MPEVDNKTLKELIAIADRGYWDTDDWDLEEKFAKIRDTLDNLLEASWEVVAISTPANDLKPVGTVEHVSDHKSKDDALAQAAGQNNACIIDGKQVWAYYVQEKD